MRSVAFKLLAFKILATTKWCSSPTSTKFPCLLDDSWGKKQLGCHDIFQKQIYCIEESTCDIVGTFRCLLQSFGDHRIHPLCPLITPCLNMIAQKYFKRKCIISLLRLKKYISSQKIKIVEYKVN